MRSTINCGFLFYLFFAGAVVSSAAGPRPAQGPTAAPEAGQATITITVTDHDHHPVSGLKAEDFSLLQDGQLQKVSSIREQVPSCVGLLLDNSGSMRPKLAAAKAALLDFVRNSNPENSFLVVNFSDSAFLDQNLTRDIKLIEVALARANARGGSAIYDALIASAEYLAKASDCQSRVLVVVSDGQDNESRQTLSQTIAKVQSFKHPVVYAIGLGDVYSPAKGPQARRALEALATGTGGASFFIGNAKDLAKDLHKVDDEMRGQYTLTYTPAHPGPDDISKLKVEVAGHKNLVVSINGKPR